MGLRRTVFQTRPSAYTMRSILDTLPEYFLKQHLF